MAEGYANSSFNYYWSVVHGPRRQPATLLPKIVSKRKELEKEGHLANVTQPADWVNSTVVSSLGEKRYFQLKQYYQFSQSTTMNTPISRYKWLKLPFRIKSAPEMYLKALEGIDHPYAIMDDLLIALRGIARAP